MKIEKENEAIVEALASVAMEDMQVSKEAINNCEKNKDDTLVLKKEKKDHGN